MTSRGAWSKFIASPSCLLSLRHSGTFVRHAVATFLHPALAAPGLSPAGTIVLSACANRGIFITFEGMDGSGKTTQMHRLAARLRAARPHRGRNRGARRHAASARRSAASCWTPPTRTSAPSAELLLYFASRAQNVDELILPALARGRDRAFRPLHGFQPGLPGLRPRPGRRNRAHAGPHRLPRPEARPHPAGGYRPRNQPGPRPRPQRRRPARETRMDEQSVDFHRKVREAYHDAGRAARPPASASWTAAPASDTIEREIWAHREPSCLTISGATRTSTEALEQMLRPGAHPADPAVRRPGRRGQGHAGPPPRRAPARPRRADRAGRPQPARTTSQPSPAREKLARRQAQRGPALLRHLPGFRHLPARRPAAPDLHRPDAACSRSARRFKPMRGQPPHLPDRSRGPRQRAGRQLAAEDARRAARPPHPDHDGGERLRPAAHHPLARRAVPLRPARRRGDARSSCARAAWTSRRSASRWPPAAPAWPSRSTWKPTTSAAPPCWRCSKSPPASRRSPPGFPYSEAIGRSKSEKLDLYLKVLYDLLRDLLVLRETGGAIRNQDLRRELEPLARTALLRLDPRGREARWTKSPA